MDKFDTLISEALSAEDKVLVDEMRDPDIFTLGYGLFRGPNGWLGFVMFFVVLAFFLAALWCGWHFYAASELIAALKWGLSAATLMIVATQLKMALIPQMQADRVIRALRRLELIALGQRG